MLKYPLSSTDMFIAEGLTTSIGFTGSAFIDSNITGSTFATCFKGVFIFRFGRLATPLKAF